LRHFLGFGRFTRGSIDIEKSKAKLILKCRKGLSKSSTIDIHHISIDIPFRSAPRETWMSGICTAARNWPCGVGLDGMLLGSPTDVRSKRAAVKDSKKDELRCK
jgi:hypothetical protein